MWRLLYLCLIGFNLGCSSSVDYPVTLETATKKTQTEKLETSPVSTQVAAEPPTLLTPEEINDGWISLFDGQTLFGWKAHTQVNWQVVDGAITANEGENGLLCTTSEFADYLLKLEFRADDKTNSGVFLRTLPIVPKDKLTTDCYELNIAPEENPFPTGSLVQRLKADGACQDAGWRTFEVTVQGDQVTVKYNDKQVLHYTDTGKLRRGHIGLQFNTGKIEFRNIKLKPLTMTSLFNGKDLAGWKTYPDMASKFSVTESGELFVENGKGQLESEGKYADFLLQLQCKTHAPQLNSGLFFRCIPGEQMNGYESQIQNGFKNGDRSQPVDCGTGGIFRRINARRVVADDQTWFSKTILAQGAHVAVWVNGYQVTDWTDDRAPDANPRKGLRVEAGTLMLQGHDPTTKLSFKNFQIMELPARVVD
jgi:Domain of Unknown Function (DUF1080)